MRKIITHSVLITWYLLLANTMFAYTHADTLRGSNGRGRDWWDVQHYSLNVQFDTAAKSIKGFNIISLKIVSTPGDSMQIDMQQPMILDSVVYGDKRLVIANENNVWWVKHPFHSWQPGTVEGITCYYHGMPRLAVRPPWDGGFIWSKDSTGNPWIAVACQGLGASSWWPCKDAQWDEPDNGQDMTFTLPAGLSCISNGKLLSEKTSGNTSTWRWQVKNPINSYDVSFYIGDYVHWSDTLKGEKGKLDLDFYALRYNEAKARKQFAVVKPMLHCFEYWMGPYPFYEDGYKLIEAPYLGMEHQSAVAYGNKYLPGYLGIDRSGNGIGLTFDYIIVHETGHEWFGNSVTARDIADNWVHEGITTFAEALFVYCTQGKERADEYSRGGWEDISNDKPIIGTYGVNVEGSGDMYRKGAAMMYMMMRIMNDDEKFRGMMRGLSDSFYHKLVTTQQVEQYIISYSGYNFAPFFNQYLRSIDIPQLEYYIKKKRLHYRFTSISKGFTLPVHITGNDTEADITPTSEWQEIRWRGGYNITFPNYYLMTVK